MCKYFCTFASKWSMSKLINITESEKSALALEFAESIHAGFPSSALSSASTTTIVASKVIIKISKHYE